MSIRGRVLILNNVLILRVILVYCIMEKTALTIEIFKYERSEKVDCDEQFAQILQFGQYV